MAGDQGLAQVIEAGLRGNGVAAGEQIDCRITVFGPCVDGQMAFGDDDRA